VAGGLLRVRLLLEVENIGGKDVRVLRSAKSPLHMAKGRFQRPMVDPLVIEADNPLDSGRILREAMAEATRVEKPPSRVEDAVASVDWADPEGVVLVLDPYDYNEPVTHRTVNQIRRGDPSP
jgi:hypothetical protein